jgi:hypothetical protein
MREIVPYKTVQGATSALDNGGRIYNLLTKAGDEIVDESELARAAGVFHSGSKAILYLEMALMDLSPAERAQVVASFSPELSEKHRALRPQGLVPSAVEERGQSGKSTVVTGYPIFVEDRTQLVGFVVLVTPVIMMVPIFDQFDVYEVFDTPQLDTPRTVVATARGSKRLPLTRTRFGGVLKELYFEDKTGKEHGLYLETAYYSLL